MNWMKDNGSGEELSWPWFGKCVEENPDYPLFEYKYSDDKMTRQMCRQICTSGYFVYFGLENGTDCFCGNLLNPNAKHVSILECTKPCSGNPFEFCGGISKLNILKTQTKCEKELEKAEDPNNPILGRYYPQCWTIDDWKKVEEGNGSLFPSGKPNEINVGAYKWHQTWDLKHTSWCVDLEGNPLNTTHTDSCSPFYTGQCTYDLFFGRRRLNGAMFSDDYLSQEKCLDACKSAFYRYAGVENGRDCYCGNELMINYLDPQFGIWIYESDPNVRIIPDIECNLPCSGDSNQKCGGENELGGNLNIFNIKSKCEKERDDGIEFIRRQPVGFVGYCYPACTESGEFEPTQSCGSTGYTWCVDMDGEEIPGTSTPPAQEPKPICNPYYTGQCVSNQNQTLVLTVSGDSMTRESCNITCNSEDSTYYALGNGRDCYCGDTVENPKLLPFPMCDSPCSGDANEMCGGVEAFNLFSLKEKENIPPLA